MKPEQKNVIDRILETANDAFHFRNAVFLTYTANLEFFEKILLQDLLRRGCDNNIVLMDKAQYRRTFEMSRPSAIGRDYVCAPIQTSATFHPKIVFLSSAKGAALFVGSGNLTQAGFSQNQELFWETRYDLGIDTEIPQPIVAAIKILADLSGRSGSVVQSRWRSLLADCPWITHMAQRKTSFGAGEAARLLCSVNGPILDQITDVLTDLRAKTTEATIISPFFDDRLDALKLFVKKTGCKEVAFLLSQGHNNFPEIDPKSVAGGTKVEIKELLGGGARPLHAKLILLKTNKGSLLATGSANFSKPALCSRFEPGNFETCLIQHDKDVDAFDGLLDGKVGARLKPSEIIRADVPETGEQERLPIEILECVLGSEGKLVVTLAEPAKGTGNLAAVIMPGPPVELPLTWKTPTHAELRLSDLPSVVAARLAAVSAAIKIVIIRKGAIQDQSSPVWVLSEGFVRRQANSELAKLGQQLYSEESTKLISSYYWWIQRLDTTLNVRESDLLSQTRLLEETESEEAQVELVDPSLTKSEIYVTENFSEQELKDLVTRSLERHSSVFDFFGLLRGIAREEGVAGDGGDESTGSRTGILRISADQKQRIARRFSRFVSEYAEKEELTVIDYNEILKLLGLAFVGLTMHIFEHDEFLEFCDDLLDRVFLNASEADQIPRWKRTASSRERTEIESRFLDGPFLSNVLLFLNFSAYVYNKKTFQLDDAVQRYEKEEKVLMAVVDFWRQVTPGTELREADVARTVEQLVRYSDYELNAQRFISAAKELFQKSPSPEGRKDRALRCRTLAVGAVITEKERACKILRRELLMLDPKSILDRGRRLRMEQEIESLNSELIDLNKIDAEGGAKGAAQQILSEPSFIILSCR